MMAGHHPEADLPRFHAKLSAPVFPQILKLIRFQLPGDVSVNQQTQAFQEFLATETAKIPLVEFLLNLALILILAVILQRVYIRFAKSLANRERFAGNFPVIGLTTMIIITVVKSSLALSLGLVGALSIVRFRTAVKDPEELSYMFVTIALGLGLGANQRAVTVIGFTVLVAVIIAAGLRRGKKAGRHLFLTVSGEGSSRFELPRVVDILEKGCAAVDLKRFDQSESAAEALFAVELDGFPQLEALRSSLGELDGSLRLTLLDHSVP